MALPGPSTYISVLDKPELYTPSGNPVIWEFKSLSTLITTGGQNAPNNNLVYFEVKIYHEDALISTLKAYATPDDPSGAYCNLSKILDSYVSTEYKSFDTGFADYMARPVFSYNLVVTEMNLNNSNDSIVAGAVYNSPTCYVFEAKFDKVSFKYYKANQYLVTSSNINLIKFLTTKPDKAVLNIYSEEGLCFLFNSYTGDVSIRYRFFDKNNTLIYTVSPLIALYPVLPHANSLYRVNVSPAYLSANLAGLDLDMVDHFTVCLTNDADVALSETKTFLYGEVPCNMSPVNFYWWNKFGGIDSFQFFVSETNQTVTKTTISLNPFKRDSKSKLREYNDKIFNTVEQVLDYTTEKKLTVNTLDLSDAQTKWLSSILLSKNIWMKADDSLIIPVSINDTDYSIAPKKTIQGLNMKQFVFKLSDGFDSDYRITYSNTVPAIITATSADFYNY